MINIYHNILGQVQTNCYLIVNEEDKQCLIVDPADEYKKIVMMIERTGCVPKGIFLTHGHFDHILAADELRNAYGIKIYASEDEKAILDSPDMNLSSLMGRTPVALKADVYLRDGEELEAAGIKIRAIHTPGHTKGSMCYYIESAKVLMSGDTLFSESVGRTDFPTGSMSEIVNSIKNKLFELPDETRVYPGHGDATEIDYEKQYNPFCQ